MSIVQPPVPERRPSPALNLSSNNPFRNRAASPASIQSLPTPTQQTVPPANFSRPVSKNPFLDSVEDHQTSPPTSGPNMATMNGKSSPTQPALTGHVAELFDNLAISNNNRPAAPVVRSATVTQGGHRRPPPPPSHRPSRSQEEEQRRRAASGKPPQDPSKLDIFADPKDQRPRDRRVRRNSDSSIMDRPQKQLDPEDEKRRRDRKAREREARHRDHKDKGSSKSKKPNQRLDIIDKLDVTSIYGTGLFHHDGPFDACNPHRNRKGSSRAPMQAFPKDSANNTMGGSGPVNSRLDLDRIHGVGPDAFDDYSTKMAERPVHPRGESYDPTVTIQAIHGDESMGLGTSTFLEGAPASRKAMLQRRESENEQQALGGGGLSRKKSLAQKIRGISNSRGQNIYRNPNSPEPGFDGRNSPNTPPTVPSHSQSANGQKKANEKNPFFQDYDAAYDRKGMKIEENKVGRPRAPSSPKHVGPGLERRVTSDGNEEPKPKEGFLTRMKSMKGGRRTRPERRE
ncbi:MAG: hypothetical protein M1834_009628 [Cirrosporium novae-zelandiae]|nr:MAG: hypothetical protein M1834_009628 [Cirrosporium novae-zelandiae]